MCVSFSVNNSKTTANKTKRKTSICVRLTTGRTSKIRKKKTLLFTCMCVHVAYGVNNSKITAFMRNNIAVKT